MIKIELFFFQLCSQIPPQKLLLDFISQSDF